MSDPFEGKSICAKCLYASELLVECWMPDGEPEANFVTGQMFQAYRRDGFCHTKNRYGNCPDFKKKPSDRIESK